MGLQATVKTAFGEDRDLYIRLNNVEASNHGVASRALFRGFLSEEAYRGGAQFMWERYVEFTPDVSSPLWEQAYAALEAELAGEEAPPEPIDGGVKPGKVTPALIADDTPPEDPAEVEARKKRRDALIADAVAGGGPALDAFVSKRKGK